MFSKHFSPTTGPRFAPTLLLAAAALVAFHAAGIWRSEALPPSSSETAAWQGIRPALAAAPDGQQLYLSRCMSCHQMNGQGVPGVFPPLVGTDWVTGDKGRLARIVLHGISGEVTVNDQVYSGAMPPWGGFLKDDEIAAILTYIRASWSNEADAVTAEEVARVRAATNARKQPWTAKELAEPANQGIPQ